MMRWLASRGTEYLLSFRSRDWRAFTLVRVLSATVVALRGKRARCVPQRHVLTYTRSTIARLNNLYAIAYQQIPR